MADLLLGELEIVAALRLLFASNPGDCRELLESVQESEIKRAYRKRAMQTHPDRFATRGPHYQKLYSERFIEISNAYETLTTYIRARERGFHFIRNGAGRNGSSRTHHEQRRHYRRSEGHFHDRFHGNFTRSFRYRDLPRRRLRFGEFLYYSGVIEWNVLVRALVWQSKQRPRIGEIAQRWRWASELQIAQLIENRLPGELIGEVMLNYNIINTFQLQVLLRQQKKIQKQIGQYFVQHRLMTERDIRETLRRQHEHNVNFGSHRRWNR